jgi:hypothetical protein
MAEWLEKRMTDSPEDNPVEQSRAVSSVSLGGSQFSRGLLAQRPQFVCPLGWRRTGLHSFRGAPLGQNAGNLNGNSRPYQRRVNFCPYCGINSDKRFERSWGCFKRLCDGEEG